MSKYGQTYNEQVLRENIIGGVKELGAIEEKLANNSLGKEHELYKTKGNVEYKVGLSFLYLSELNMDEKNRLSAIYYILRAIESNNTALSLKENANLHKQNGRSILLLGYQSSLGVQEYKKAITINPQDDESYLELGEYYFDNKDYIVAHNYYLSGITINPNNELINISIMKTYYLKGDFTNGWEAIKKLHKTCINYCNNVNYYAAKLLQNSELIEKDPNLILNLVNNAITYSEKKGEKYPDAYKLKGDILYLLGKKEDALMAYARINSNDYRTYRYDTSINSYAKETFYRIIQINIEIGMYDRAENHIKNGLQKFPKDKTLLELWEKNKILKSNIMPMRIPYGMMGT